MRRGARNHDGQLSLPGVGALPNKLLRPKGKKDVEGAGYPLLDIVLSKTGEKLSTKWTVTPAPTEYEGDGVPTVDMDAEIVMVTADVLSRLQATKPKPTLRCSRTGKIEACCFL